MPHSRRLRPALFASIAGAVSYAATGIILGDTGAPGLIVAAFVFFLAHVAVTALLTRPAAARPPARFVSDLDQQMEFPGDTAFRQAGRAIVPARWERQ